MEHKIQLANPFFLDYKISVDFEDFERIDVGTKGVQESNHFLWKLWHLFDVNYAPKTADHFAPWAFLPNKYKGKKNQVLVLGNINTSLGNFYVIISYVRKGDIDSIGFYSSKQNDNTTKKLLRKIVYEALENIDKLETFHCKVELFSHFENLKFSTYVGDRFKIYTKDDKNYVGFDILCTDKYEAYHLGMERMKYFIAFLSVETNILFDYEPIDFNLEIDNVEPQELKFMENFIDYYSIVNDEVTLSKEAFQFLNQYIFVERDFNLSEECKYFLLGCIHVYDRLVEELFLSDIVKYSLPNYSLSVFKNQVKDKQEKYSHSVMHYLSAIETASYVEGKHETCDLCGSVKYKIGTRVKDFVTKYFDDGLGKLFKGLYSIRSKYLHTGILSTSGDFLNGRPLLDYGTESGLNDLSFISVKANGGIFLVNVNNIREWTTFCLRCYYHEKLFGNTNYNVTDTYNNNSSSYIKHYSYNEKMSFIVESES